MSLLQRKSKLIHQSLRRQWKREQQRKRQRHLRHLHLPP